MGCFTVNCGLTGIAIEDGDRIVWGFLRDHYNQKYSNKNSAFREYLFKKEIADKRYRKNMLNMKHEGEKEIYDLSRKLDESRNPAVFVGSGVYNDYGRTYEDDELGVNSVDSPVFYFHQEAIEFLFNVEITKDTDFIRLMGRVEEYAYIARKDIYHNYQVGTQGFLDDHSEYEKIKIISHIQGKILDDKTAKYNEEIVEDVSDKIDFI